MKSVLSCLWFYLCMSVSYFLKLIFVQRRNNFQRWTYLQKHWWMWSCFLAHSISSRIVPWVQPGYVTENTYWNNWGCACSHSCKYLGTMKSQHHSFLFLIYINMWSLLQVKNLFPFSGTAERRFSDTQRHLHLLSVCSRKCHFPLLFNKESIMNAFLIGIEKFWHTWPL